MHLTRGVHHKLPEAPSASDLLGADHPLVRVLDQLGVAWRQALVVAGLLMACSVAALEGVSRALALAVAAAVVEVVLLCRGAALLYDRHEQALDLIAQGHGDLGLDAVERVRRRLLDPTRRRRLASALDDMRQEAVSSPGPVRPLFNRRVIAAVASELGTIADLLRRDEASEQGVALANRLVVDGGSVLYRDDVAALREELCRIRYLLETRTGRPDQPSIPQRTE